MPDQYKIPQNIDVEDKILGPFTLKQFLYIMVGGILIYVFFNMINIDGLGTITYQRTMPQAVSA